MGGEKGEEDQRCHSFHISSAGLDQVSSSVSSGVNQLEPNFGLRHKQVTLDTEEAFCARVMVFEVSNAAEPRYLLPWEQHAEPRCADQTRAQLLSWGLSLLHPPLRGSPGCLRAQ